MSYRFNHSPIFPEDACFRSEMYLLEQLLKPVNPHETHSPYIWDPQSPETEAYISSLEQSFDQAIDQNPTAAENLSFATIAPHLDRLWARVESQMPPVVEPTAPALKNLFPHFPKSWLDHILKQAETIGLESLSLTEQLLQCVQDLFPGWNVEDLQVIARPYAFAMRSFSPAADLTTDLSAAEWEHLSDLEQIRLSLAVAKAALHDRQ